MSALLFVLNPFTIGWQPISTGIWAGAGFFLLATLQLLPFLWESSPNRSRLWRASILMGIAVGFHISLIPVSLALLFLFLHLEFWNKRRISFWDAFNYLLMPLALIGFALWCLAIVRLAGPFRFESMCIVLLPGLIAFSLPWLVLNRQIWITSAVCALVILSVLAVERVPNVFVRGPEFDMPQMVRGLRDELRRSPIRAVTVQAEPELIEALEFYRHRYGLGAVRVQTSQTPKSIADYRIEKLTGSAGHSGNKVLESGSLILVSAATAPTKQ